ncbi:hypothetical protein OUZ56_019729 [Daphnia magna]|uniref:Uncharacterized protein n=1 Tax=Daphnia magna TaxID=35525 RepID=A0ABQ9ZCF7_9CRUS|nr:hypothetical protein OUZ56_019729 [Daphnia magna]
MQASRNGLATLTSGIFTVPRTGRCFFSFSGLSWFEQANVEMHHQYSPLSLQSTLNLQTEDEFWLQIYGLSSGIRFSIVINIST